MSSHTDRILTVAVASTMLLGGHVTPSLAQPAPGYGNPSASYQVPSGIGYWKAKRDRADLRRYQGDPAAQEILRQQRTNLCRNNPEVC